MLRLAHFDRRFSLYPHPGAAGKRLIRRVADDARAINPHLMAVLVVLVGLHRQDWLALPGLGVPADDMLVDVDDVLHVYDCTLFVTGRGTNPDSAGDGVLAEDADGVFCARKHHVVACALACTAGALV